MFSFSGSYWRICFIKRKEETKKSENILDIGNRGNSTGIPGRRAVHLQKGFLGLTGASQKTPLREYLR